MDCIFMLLLIILSVLLIVLITIQPRQTQIFSNDATSNIRRSSYWSSQKTIKLLTLGISLLIFIFLIILIILSYSK